MTDMDYRPTCLICETPGVPVGFKRSDFSGEQYEIRRCGRCGFAFVSNPRLDFDAIYDDDYYRGKGADPLIDYEYEADQPDRTVRRYEWIGIARAVSALMPITSSTRWLDYGCGTGGLVRFLSERSLADAVGWDEHRMQERLEARGIPSLTREDLERERGSFDVVTAIEVLEHTLDPVAELQRIRTLLRPGGLLWLTTGNAAPYHDRLPKWRYVMPDIHISFFEPRTLGIAMRRAGFEPTYPGFGPGWDVIIKYKVLKALGRKAVRPLDAAVPWGPVSRVIDRRLQLSAQPVGWAVA